MNFFKRVKSWFSKKEDRGIEQFKKKERQDREDVLNRYERKRKIAKGHQKFYSYRANFDRYQQKLCQKRRAKNKLGAATRKGRHDAD